MRWVVLVVGLAGCAPNERVVASGMPPQPFCTRTLGVAQCFADPASLPDRPAELVETPSREHVACAPWWRDGGLVCLLGQPGRP